MANPFVDRTWNTVVTGGDFQATQVQLTISEDGQGSYPGGSLVGSFGPDEVNILTYIGTWSESDDNGPFAFFIVGDGQPEPVFLGVWTSVTASSGGGEWNGLAQETTS